MYLAGHDASDARVSPLLSSSFEGLPSVYLEWALDEFLAPDIASLSQKMTQDGVALETRMEPRKRCMAGNFCLIFCQKRSARRRRLEIGWDQVGPSTDLIKASKSKSILSYLLFGARQRRGKAERVGHTQEPEQENPSTLVALQACVHGLWTALASSSSTAMNAPRRRTHRTAS